MKIKYKICKEILATNISLKGLEKKITHELTLLKAMDMPSKLTTSRRFKLTTLCRRILTTSSVFLQERSFPCFD